MPLWLVELAVPMAGLTGLCFLLRPPARVQAGGAANPDPSLVARLHSHRRKRLWPPAG
jgi:hypothetical protein